MDRRSQEIDDIAYARKASQWLTLREFATTAECIKALREEKMEIWATDLSQQAVCLDEVEAPLPPKLAIVMGTESDGRIA